MSSLSPPARRLIERALRQQGDDRQLDDWRRWDVLGSDCMPFHIAQVAIHALSGMSLAIERELDNPETDSRVAAQLENDLGYIADIEAFLAKSMRQSTAASAE